MSGAQKKSLDLPDERIEVEGIAADVVQIADSAISRNVFQPDAHCALRGARLSGGQRANRSCMAHHTGVLLEGNLHVEMDDGSTLEIGPCDVFDIPPGHDGWVTGDKPMVGINCSGVRSWIPERETGERVLASALFSDIVDVRQGIHTGEVEVVGDDVRGIAVHEAARIATAAAPGEILVSSTTEVLAEGGEIAFVDRGSHELRGLSGTRQLFAVDG